MRTLFQDYPSQCFPINWHDNLERVFSTQIKVIADDEPGLLSKISSSIANSGTNIESLSAGESTPGIGEIVLLIQVTGRDHLAKLIRKLRRMKTVLSVTRIHDQEMRKVKTLH